MAASPMPPPGSSAPDQGAEPSNASPPTGGRDQALTQMIVQTDQALTNIAQIVAQQSPEAGSALAELNDQFRQLISSLMSGAQQPQKAQKGMGMAPMETGGKEAQLAY